jgi:polyvinyl alcohol dehydrogenase (cytochrome)
VFAFNAPFLGSMGNKPLNAPVVGMAMSGPVPATQPAAGGLKQAPTYRGDLGRSGFYPSETGLTVANAPNLGLHWTDTGGGGAFSQPIVENNMVYWADWRGNEHGTDLNGHDVWQTDLGTTTPPPSDNCRPATAGPTSTATVATLSGRRVVYVGGGNDVFYALNADTGAIIWQTRLGPSPDTFIWGSPALYNGSIYIGVASYGDCPLVQGKLMSLDAGTGTILATANMVPNGCVGGGIWSSPTIDTSDASVWVTTGTPAGCGQPGPRLAPSIVKLQASDLTVLGSWTVPAVQQAAGDADFGATPTLFTATIGGQPHSLVGAANKDGIFYAWDRTPDARGQLQVVWQTTIATASPSPSTSSIVSAAWDGRTLYVGGGDTTINGTSCQGNVDALDPATGAFVWQTCLANHIDAAITAVPGVIVEGTLGNSVVFLDTSNGNKIFSYSTSAPVTGESTVASGVVYIPVSDGSLVALGQ